MANPKHGFIRWIPALLWMGLIFLSSGTPASNIPKFGAVDFIVKKGGHSVSYAILALAYRRALGTSKREQAAAWVLAVLYALSDEFHQSFVPGRHPSLIDALVFDGGGALTALLLSGGLAARRRQSAQISVKEN